MASTVIDYSPYLHVLENGSLWWHLEDAIKLGAGYLPIRDDTKDLDPILRATSNQVRANELTLLSEFNKYYNFEANLKILVRNDNRYVEAHEFLSWLSQHISLTQLQIPLPKELIREVRCSDVKVCESEDGNFNSLATLLDGWFDKLFEEMPNELRQRVESDLSPMPWNDLSPDQRRSMAAQWDYLHDPATENERHYWWDFNQGMQELEDRIKQWELVATTTATDLAQKENRLAELRVELVNMEKKESQPYVNPIDSHNESDSILSKHPGHLNHDLDMQMQANKIALELSPSKKRRARKNEVAKILSEKLEIPVDTVLRRIRVKW